MACIALTPCCNVPVMHVGFVLLVFVILVHVDAHADAKVNRPHPTPYTLSPLLYAVRGAFVCVVGLGSAVLSRNCALLELLPPTTRSYSVDCF